MNLEHFQKKFSQFLYDPHKKKGELAYYFTDEKALNHYHQSLLYNLIETLTENFSKGVLLKTPSHWYLLDGVMEG